jgi:hypothetical protein
MKELYDLEEEYKFLNATKKEEEKEKINEVMERIQVLRRDLVNLETSLQSVYQHTADAKAERETLAWYVINLSKIIDENGKAKSYFNGIDYDEQLEDFYDKFESENKAERETAEKLTKIVNFWFYSQSSTKKDIDAFLKQDAN